MPQANSTTSIARDLHTRVGEHSAVLTTQDAGELVSVTH